MEKLPGCRLAYEDTGSDYVLLVVAKDIITVIVRGNDFPLLG
jgi:hypothetical protein